MKKSGAWQTNPALPDFTFLRQPNFLQFRTERRLWLWPVRSGQKCGLTLCSQAFDCPKLCGYATTSVRTEAQVKKASSEAEFTTSKDA